MTSAAAGAQAARADVELRVPADTAYVSVLRTTTAGLAARLDFTLDDIEDLRMAVGEASALVFPAARSGADATCEFFMQPAQLTVVVSVPAVRPTAPDEDSFAWQVLTTLSGDASVDVADGRFAIRLTMHSALQQSNA